MDTIVVPETFSSAIEDEAFEQIVSQKLRRAAAEEGSSEADSCQTATSTQVILIVRRGFF